MNEIKPWSRRTALVRLALLIAAVVLAKLLVAEAGEGASNKLRALPVLPLVLTLVPILELILNAPFSQLSVRWNYLPSWKQWSIVLAVLFALAAIFVGLSAIAHHAHSAA